MAMIATMEEYQEQWGKVTDFTTKDGKCSNCGNCCSNILPMSNKEAKSIYHYVKKHHIKPVMHGALAHADEVYDGTCPFRDDGQEKCLIYPVRPFICRAFTCNKFANSEKCRTTKKLDVVDMRKTFCGGL